MQFSTSVKCESKVLSNIEFVATTDSREVRMRPHDYDEVFRNAPGSPYGIIKIRCHSFRCNYDSVFFKNFQCGTYLTKQTFSTNQAFLLEIGGCGGGK